MTIGDSIRTRRKALKLTQKELAKKAGISETALINYEKNRRTPPINIIGRLAEVLEIEVSELLGEIKSVHQLQMDFYSDIPETMKSFSELYIIATIANVVIKNYVDNVGKEFVLIFCDKQGKNEYHDRYIVSYDELLALNETIKTSTLISIKSFIEGLQQNKVVK